MLTEIKKRSQNGIGAFGGEPVDGQTQVEVRFDHDTIWLSQTQMANLFDKDSDTIGLHLKNVYKYGELDENSTTEQSSVVRKVSDKGTGVIEWDNSVR